MSVSRVFSQPLPWFINTHTVDAKQLIRKQSSVLIECSLKAMRAWGLVWVWLPLTAQLQVKLSGWLKEEPVWENQFRVVWVNVILLQPWWVRWGGLSNISAWWNAFGKVTKNKFQPMMCLSVKQLFWECAKTSHERSLWRMKDNRQKENYCGRSLSIEIAESYLITMLEDISVWLVLKCY